MCRHFGLDTAELCLHLILPTQLTSKVRLVVICFHRFVVVLVKELVIERWRDPSVYSLTCWLYFDELVDLVEHLL